MSVKVDKLALCEAVPQQEVQLGRVPLRWSEPFYKCKLDYKVVLFILSAFILTSC